MKLNKILFLGIGFLFGVVFTFTAMVLLQSKSRVEISAHAHEVLPALLKASDFEIGDSSSCELEPEIEGQKLPLVRDFISSRLLLAMRNDNTEFENFHCEGSGPTQCRWIFGKDKEVEGWARTLEFAYDESSHSVKKDGIRCIDVP